jgi:hypothetical protein
LSAQTAWRSNTASRDDRIPKGDGALPKRDRQPPLIIYLEIALDIILANEQILREAFAAFKRCFVQLWNGKNEAIEFDNGGMSTGRRWNGKYLSGYISKPSPVTGEVDCLHIRVSDLLCPRRARRWHCQHRGFARVRLPRLLAEAPRVTRCRYRPARSP